MKTYLHGWRIIYIEKLINHTHHMSINANLANTEALIEYIYLKACMQILISILLIFNKFCFKI